MGPVWIGHVLAKLQDARKVRQTTLKAEKKKQGGAMRCGEMRGDTRRCDEILGDARRCREMRGDAGRCREMQGAAL